MSTIITDKGIFTGSIEDLKLFGQTSMKPNLETIAKIYLRYFNDDINGPYALYLIRLELGITDNMLVDLTKGDTE